MSEGKSLLPEWWWRLLAELPKQKILVLYTKPANEAEAPDGDGD